VRDLLRQSRYVTLVAGLLLLVVAGGTFALVSRHSGGGGQNVADSDGNAPGGASAGDPGGATAGPSAHPTAGPSASARPSSSPAAHPPANDPPPIAMVGGCAPHPSSCGFPDATNTGVPAGTKLTSKSGDMEIKTAGTVIQNIDLQGCISIWAPNVTIKNSRIHCGGPYGIFSYDKYYTGGGAVFTDVEVDCMNTQATGIASYGFKATRINVHGCENGFTVDYSVTIQDSYVWGSFTGNGGHSDGIEIHSANNMITHNTIFNGSPGGTSAIITDPTGLSNVTISNNLLAGGGYTLYCPKTTSSAVTVTANRFGKIYNPKSGSYAAWTYCNAVAVVHGNVWDDTLGAIPF
jgi:hypothetical protein